MTDNIVNGEKLLEDLTEIRKNIVEHLQQKDAQSSKTAATPLEWKQETNTMGQVAFWWYKDKRSIVAVLSTGSTVKGTVAVKRYYDELLGEWIYKTERIVEGNPVYQFSRLVKKKDDDYWIFRTFACNHAKYKVIEQLTSDNPQDKNAFQPLEWIQETNIRGVITFGWLYNGRQKNIGISTGHPSRGMTTVSRYYDNNSEEWIYKTERDIDGEKIYRYSKLTKSRKEKYWVFKIYDPCRDQIISHLRAKNAQDKKTFEPIEWVGDTNLGGQITFSWPDNGVDIDVVLTTSVKGKGQVKIKRYFKEDMNEWIYETERNIDGRIFKRLSRIVPTEKEGIKYWRFKIYDQNKSKVIAQLRSVNAQDKDAFEPLQWEAETGNHGIIWFRWLEKNEWVRVVLYTGVSKEGYVRVKRYYDNDKKEWMYETERKVNNQTVFQKSRLARKEAHGLKYWKFKLVKKGKTVVNN